MDLQSLFNRVDHVIGGAHAHRVVEVPSDARVQRAFCVITALLIAACAVSVAAIAVAVGLLEHREVVGIPVWIRCGAVAGISATLFYFLSRMRRGYLWAYRRLALFTTVFPLIALVLAVIPGLFPAWVDLEQILFAVLLVGISCSLRVEPLRRAFGRPRAA